MKKVVEPGGTTTQWSLGEKEDKIFHRVGNRKEAFEKERGKEGKKFYPCCGVGNKVPYTHW